MSSVNRPFEQFDPSDSSSNASPGQTPDVNAPHGQPPVTLLPCDEVADLIPAHSIGATDPEEAAAVHARLSACPTAAAALADYSKIAEALLYATPPQRAPTHLAQQLRAAIGAPPVIPLPVHPLIKRQPPVALRTDGVPSRKPSPFTLVTPSPKPVSRWTFGRSLATAASLLLVGLNLALLVQNQQLRTRQEQLDAELNQQNKALIFLAAEEPHEVILPAAQADSMAQADVLWNSSLGIAVVYVRAFPDLPPDQAYQIWLNQDGQRTSPGLFTVESGGMGIFVFPIQQSLDLYDVIGITPEPAGGSPGPTAPPVVRGPV